MILDNLDSLEDLSSGLQSKTTSLLGHVMYTNNELMYANFYQTMFDILKDEQIKTVLDVGGCTGEFSKIMMEKIPSIEKCIIVEPLTRNYHFIKYRFCNESRIEVLKKCVFYGQDTIDLFAEDGNVGGAHMSSSQNAETIKTSPLEDFPVCDFIKLDVESAEWRIIENSTSLDKFTFIQIEFHDLLNWHSAGDWENFLKKHLPNHEVIIDGKDFPREWGGSWFEQVLLKRNPL
jgi:FkbM family methyltransferase